MTQQNTSRSDFIINEFKNHAPQQMRRSYSFTGTWKASPEEIFILLCPAREADWIPKWSAKIIYSSTGYAEDKCIFETSDVSAAGKGLWTFTTHEKNRLVEYVGFGSDTITHGSIPVTDNGDGTTSATWNITVTALTENGIEKVAKLPEGFQVNSPVGKLIRHFLETGEIANLDLGHVHD